MISVEECKHYLDDLGLDDRQIKEIRDALEAFIQQTLDFTFDTDTILNANKNENSKKRENRTT